MALRTLRPIAGAFAAFALSNHIPVAAWELCNEPYLFQSGTNRLFHQRHGLLQPDEALPRRHQGGGFQRGGGRLLQRPGPPSLAWDNALANYTNKYWDAVVYHYYPQLPTNVPFADLMAMDNGMLFSNSTLYVTNTSDRVEHQQQRELSADGVEPGKGRRQRRPDPAHQHLVWRHLRGGICDAVVHLPAHELCRQLPIGEWQRSGYDQSVLERGDQGRLRRLCDQHRGVAVRIFLERARLGEAVAYWAMNRSTAVYATTVGTNGPVVPMDTNGIATMPAIYAQAYQGGNGKRYVLLTNKGSNAVPVQITRMAWR